MKKLPIKIHLSDGFLKEETRCGYTIGADMKAVWAVELDLYKELERVALKYNLRIFADSGTLIGAIRHKGFIPWDDDIDIVMFRNDYEKLKRIAPIEFKHPYFFQTIYTDELYIRGHAQLRNTNTTGFIREDANKPFNKGIFLDIFVLDVVPDNLLLRKIHICFLRFLWKIISYKTYSPKEKHSIKGKIVGYTVKNVFFKLIDYKKFFSFFDWCCGVYNKTQNHTVSYISYSLGKDKHMFDKYWYSKSKKVQYEFSDIIIPQGYDERLKKEYGEYMKIKKVSSSHGSIIFNAYKSYYEKAYFVCVPKE